MSSPSPPPKKQKRSKTDHTAAPKSYDLPSDINYEQLSLAYPALQAHLTPTHSINFSSSTSIRVLNQALLHVYFDLQVTLPQENLCPIVLNRLNYLRWIQHYILSDFPFCDPKGLDIGTGASCIYPLLGARAIPGSSFIATDISPESVAVAQDNIERNALESRIHLYLNPDRTTTLPLDAPGFPSLVSAGASHTDTSGELMFSMCNPPFYASSEERMRLKGAKVQEPVLDANGKDEELFTEGGEQAFLQGMVDESQKWGARIKWYTTMVGRKSTLAEVKARIRPAGARQVREGTLVQGRTTRWVLAWSFLDKSRFSIVVKEKNAQETREWIRRVFEELAVRVRCVDDGFWRCEAAAMTWTR
ncbi:hypothetical protein GGF37_006183, partial [Kickxella alabastrina]